MPLDSLLRDFRWAFRNMAKRPGLLVVTVGLLSLGMTVLLVLVSAYDQVMVRDLPVARPNELALVHKLAVAPNGETQDWPRFSLEECSELHLGVRQTLQLACYATGKSVVGFAPDSAVVQTTWVTPNFFEVLGAGFVLGQGPAPSADFLEISGPAIVLSCETWLSRFGGQRDVLGRKLIVDGNASEIVGVTARGFLGTEIGVRPDLFALAVAAPRARAQFRALGRLSPTSSLPQAQVLVRAAYVPIAARRPQAVRTMLQNGRVVTRGERLDVVPGRRGESALRGSFAESLRIALAIVGLVELILCVNLANLFARRAQSARPQAALKLALGATQLRLAMAWLCESALLSGLSTIVAVGLTAVIGPKLLQLLPELQEGASLSVAIDVRVVAAAVILFVGATATMSGIAVWETARMRLEAAPAGLRVSDVPSRGIWRLGLVSVQVGLSLVLLTCTWLLLATLRSLLQVETGIPLEHVLSFTVERQGNLGSSAELEDLRKQIGAIPGVANAAYSAEGVFTGAQEFTEAAIEGYDDDTGDGLPALDSWSVSPEFFESLGLRVTLGRSMTATDSVVRLTMPAVVNERFVAKYLARRNPLGRRLSLDPNRRDWSHERAGDLVIVGVVADGVLTSPREQLAPRLYLPTDGNERSVVFYARVVQKPEALIPDVKRVLRSAPLVGASRFSNLSNQRLQLLEKERLLGRMGLLAATTSALIAALGLYGVLELILLRRAKEFAIRVATGARPGSVAWLAARGVLMPVLAGILGGLLASVATIRLLRSVLFRVAPGDPLVFGGATLLVILVSALSCWRPIQRAVCADPVRALREI